MPVMQQGWAVIRGNNALYALDWRTPRMPAHWAAFTLPAYLREQLGEQGMRAIRLSAGYAVAALRRRAGIAGGSWHPGRSLDGDIPGVARA